MLFFERLTSPSRIPPSPRSLLVPGKEELHGRDPTPLSLEDPLVGRTWPSPFSRPRPWQLRKAPPHKARGVLLTPCGHILAPAQPANFRTHCNTRERKHTNVLKWFLKPMGFFLSSFLVTSDFGIHWKKFLDLEGWRVLGGHSINGGQTPVLSRWSRLSSGFSLFQNSVTVSEDAEIN